MSNEMINSDNKSWIRSIVDARMACKRADNRRNAAAIADFASNLLSLVARDKGMIYDVAGDGVSNVANEAFENTQELYRKAASLDYRGRIAEKTFNNRDSQERKSASFGNIIPSSAIPTFADQYAKSFKKIKPLKDDIVQKIKNVRKTPIWYSNKKQ